MTHALPSAVDVRDCRLYRFWVRDPDTGERVFGYLGETVRQPLARLVEHLNSQPWADTIIGWEVDDRVFAGKDAVLAAERAAVEAELPLYNDEWNRGNPHRIDLEQARLQRWARDDAAGKPRWAPPAKRPRAAPRTVSAPASRTARLLLWWAVLPPWRQKAALWSVGWSASTLTLWASLARLGFAPDWRVNAGAAALLSAWALVWAVRHKPKRRKRRGRRR